MLAVSAGSADSCVVHLHVHVAVAVKVHVAVYARVNLLKRPRNSSSLERGT
jgi:hypothetical protein